jgi:phosphatidate cytidylyltransferase|tara:strand:- start:663 stop:1322 length:660 start_codon:yes stop_codon:yes gene_type:complete
MSEFNKRIITSFFLILVIFISFQNLKILGFFLLILTFLSLDELHNMFKKIYKKKKLFLFIANFLSVLYLSYFSLTIIIFLSEEFVIHKYLVLYLLIICILTDIGGYLFGKIIGGKKLTKISPNKTFSGSVGSFLSSIFIGYLCYKIQTDLFLININIFILIIITSLISQVGDLFISLLKRKAKIKDTGSILPGHGGVLDRIDGILFAIPIGLLVIKMYT